MVYNKLKWIHTLFGYDVGVSQSLRTRHIQTQMETISSFLYKVEIVHLTYQGGLA